MRQILSYTVEDVPLGSGGMGTVLKGVSPDGRPVAIKEILPQFVSDIEYRSRIEREIQFLRQFNNDNVVRVYDHFELGGNLYIVMELVEGMNLEQYVASRGPIEWPDALRYMTALLDTLQYVHEKGIVHRDIKPGNIMLRPDGRICLLDFGVAKDVAHDTGGTVYGTVIGTDGYMSPEQANGMSIDRRSDIYALGCVLYFMLTGRHAFEKMPSNLEMEYNIIHKPFPRLADRVSNLPASIQEMLDGAVDKNMMKRYQSCREFKDRMVRLLPGGTQLNSSINLDNRIVLSIGRENCDICIAPDNFKVSRHHADVRYKRFTGGECFIFTDCSSNGTIINGQMLRKGQSYHIGRGERPEIFLAGDLTCRLDMAEVERIMLTLAGSGSEPDGRRMEPRRGADADSSATFKGAVANCFRKYACFKGRASRSEYWWFFLLNIMVGTLCALLYLASDFKPEFLVVSGVWSLATLLPGLAVSIRRLHDVDKGWGTFLLCILGSVLPLVGIGLAIWLIILLSKEGAPEENKYGPRPY